MSVDVSVKPVSKKIERELRRRKIVIRHLPPDFTEEKLLELLEPLAPHSNFYFAIGDPRLGKAGFSRAYVNFESEDDILEFRDKFDGYQLIGSRGTTYRIIVEFAPFQRCPRKKKRVDPKCGTIEDTPEFRGFMAEYEAEPEALPAIDPTLYAMKDMSSESVRVTPLVQYLKDKKAKGPRGKVSGKSSDSRKALQAEKTKKGSDIVVTQKKTSSGASKGDKTEEDTVVKTSKTPKRKQAKFDEEPTVRIVGKSRSDTRGGGRKSAAAKDSRSDPTLAGKQTSFTGASSNGIIEKKVTASITKPIDQTSYNSRKAPKGGRPDRGVYMPPRRSGRDTDDQGKDGGYRNSYDYQEGDQRDGYSRGSSGRYRSTPRAQEGRKTSNHHEYT